MSQLCKYYFNIANEEITSTNPKKGYKKKNNNNNKDRLKFVRPKYHSNWNSSKFIMSPCDDRISECVNAAILGEKIKK